MHLLTSLLLLIVSARILGQLFHKFNQPAIVGEMLAGVILGPSVFNLIHPGPALSGISELAVFLVVLSAGLEMNFKDVFNSLKGKGLVIAVLGFIFPFVSGILVGFAFDLGVMRSTFLGLCVSITALPVAVSILQSFKLLNTDIAKYSVATAIVNDVFALLMLGVILNLPEQRTFAGVATSVLYTGGKLVLLGGIIVGINLMIEKIIDRGIHIQKFPEKLVKIFGNEALFGIVLLFVLTFGSFSENLGFHFVIGAFFGALLIDKKFFISTRYEEVEHTLASITNGFLAPVFFAYLGLEFNVASMKSMDFVVVVIFVSIFSKILAGYFGGKIIGLSQKDALGTGIILNARGVMELVVATIAYERGFIGQGLFSTLLLMGVVTTIITPLMFRYFILNKAEPSITTGVT